MSGLCPKPGVRRPWKRQIFLRRQLPVGCVGARAVCCTLSRRNSTTATIPQLSMGPFWVTRSNPNHQLTDPTHYKWKNLDPTRPNPIQLTLSYGQLWAASLIGRNAITWRWSLSMINASRSTVCHYNDHHISMSTHYVHHLYNEAYSLVVIYLYTQNLSPTFNQPSVNLFMFFTDHYTY